MVEKWPALSQSILQQWAAEGPKGDRSADSQRMIATGVAVQMHTPKVMRRDCDTVPRATPPNLVENIVKLDSYSNN